MYLLLNGLFSFFFPEEPQSQPCGHFLQNRFKMINYKKYIFTHIYFTKCAFNMMQITH